MNACIFPGQGSQSVGMLDGWGDHPIVRDTLAEASEALGQDVGQLIAQGPAEALALTTNTQPVMLVAGVAAYRAWLAAGGATPDWVAGHSLGEYAALVAAGVLQLKDAVPLVDLRAKAMQAAVPAGESRRMLRDAGCVMSVRSRALPPRPSCPGEVPGIRLRWMQPVVDRRDKPGDDEWAGSERPSRRARRRGGEVAQAPRSPQRRPRRLA